MSLSNGQEGDLGPEADRIAVIQKALSSGITLLNTADLYGPYANHILIGMVCSEHHYTGLPLLLHWLLHRLLHRLLYRLLHSDYGFSL